MGSGTTLIIRIGAMGDIIHTLPAAASLKASFPDRRLVWLVAERWLPLLEGNPAIDDMVLFDRGSWGGLRETARALRRLRVDRAIDFQGLLKSAVSGRVARPSRLFGFEASEVRERAAAWFYTDRIPVTGPHRVERNLQLAHGAGATQLTYDAWIPAGREEGGLPQRDFVLATPFAGWASKEWPLKNFDELGKRLRQEGLELVANVPPSRMREIEGFQYLRPHQSSLAGLIGAMRRATAVVACDSGPLHLAAALGKRGVALFGPTDPKKNGPFGGSLTVLRTEAAKTTYKRDDEIHASMRAISVDHVMAALAGSLAGQGSSAT